MQDISKILYEKRTELNISIDEVAKKLNIRGKYIRAIEEGNFEEIPGKVYTEGYIKMYLKYLGLNLKSENLKEEKDTVIEKNCVPINAGSKYYIIIPLVAFLIICIGWIYKNSKNKIYAPEKALTLEVDIFENLK